MPRYRPTDLDCTICRKAKLEQEMIPVPVAAEAPGAVALTPGRHRCPKGCLLTAADVDQAKAEAAGGDIGA